MLNPQPMLDEYIFTLLIGSLDEILVYSLEPRCLCGARLRRNLP